MKKNKKKLSIQKVKVVELKRNQAVGGLVAREGEENMEGRDPYTSFCAPPDGDDDGPDLDPISLGTIRTCFGGSWSI